MYALKLRRRGIPKASAQCTCANAGGFEIMASAAKARPVIGHGEWHECQHPSIISVSILRFLRMSPFVRDASPGIRPGSSGCFVVNTCLRLFVGFWERTFDHVAHQVLGISTDAEEFEACVGHELPERFVRCDAYAMSVFEESFPEGHIGLYITYHRRQLA
jgi:hypothetical protein